MGLCCPSFGAFGWKHEDNQRADVAQSSCTCPESCQLKDVKATKTRNELWTGKGTWFALAVQIQPVPRCSGKPRFVQAVVNSVFSSCRFLTKNHTQIMSLTLGLNGLHLS